MTTAVSQIIDRFACPRCGSALQPPPGTAEAACPNCRWRGRAYLFRPLLPRVDQPEPVGPEDAPCVHHPASRAVATCAGTGDYVCDLCLVEVAGQAYSAQYLDGAGKPFADRVFARFLRRPDNEAVLVLVLLPVFWPLALLLSPFVAVRLPRAFKLRREDPLYARVVSRSRIILLLIGVLIVVGLALVGAVAGAVSIAESMRETVHS